MRSITCMEEAVVVILDYGINYAFQIMGTIMYYKILLDKRALKQSKNANALDYYEVGERVFSGVKRFNYQRANRSCNRYSGYLHPFIESAKLLPELCLA